MGSVERIVHALYKEDKGLSHESMLEHISRPGRLDEHKDDRLTMNEW
jgi:hypothetical protein